MSIGHHIYQLSALLSRLLSNFGLLWLQIVSYFSNVQRDEVRNLFDLYHLALDLNDGEADQACNEGYDSMRDEIDGPGPRNDVEK